MGLIGRTVHIFIFISCVIKLFGVVSATGCGNSPMDIVMLLDSSEGSHVTSFEQEKQFATSLINDLWDGSNRVGLVTFGSSAVVQFNLDTYGSIDEIQMAIQYMWLTTGKADIGGAIKYAVDHTFSADVGGRDVAPDVLILVTPLDIRNETSVRLLADELQRSDVELFVIIASSSIDTFWYKKFVAIDHIIKVNNGNELLTVSNSIKVAVCKGRGVLRQWSPWSACASSCGAGLRRRFRSCEKRSQDDADCEGELLDENRCYNDPCTAHIDGSWSIWDTWSDCSKTCGKGTKTRVRTCTAPFPENGGEQCHGEGTQTSSCSDWSCPDCNKVCPPGSQLSVGCDVCKCSDVVLYGTVQTNTVPVRDAGVYFKSRMYSPLVTTDYTGFFRIDGICILNEVILVRKDGYSEDTVTAEAVNGTHWKINATIYQYVLPIFTFHPEDKTRLVGQSVTMCCQAIGEPQPIEYTWFQGLRSMGNRGANGTLTIDAITIADTGDYHCSAETEAGSEVSKYGTLIVKDAQNDSCSSPETYLEDLPDGCYVDGDSSQTSTIDIGSCGKGSCVSRELHDNGTCSEWWGNYCCDPDDFDWVLINCKGFSYQTRRVRTCRCRMCFTKTVITGKAYGRFENGTEILLKLGSVSANGKEVARTNMAGVFTFEIPKTVEKLVVNFDDKVFGRFVPTTKVIRVTPGSSTSLTIALSLKPDPVDFQVNDGLQLEVGGNKGHASVGSILIQDNALLTEAGEPYNGSAKAHVHYMDPRNFDDFEAANGEFTFEQDGQSCPLETFGVFKTKFEDDKGNSLQMNKPMKFEIDPAVYNISTTSDGEPDVELWRMDSNSGTWTPAGKMRFEQSTARRKLLNSMIVGEDSNAIEVPSINFFVPVYNTKTVVSYTTFSVKRYYLVKVKRRWWSYNWDKRSTVEYRSRPNYRTITERAPDRVKSGACYISVSVYKTLNGVERETGGTQVTAVTKHATQNRYLGFDKKPTDTNGHVCLSIFCDSIVYLSAQNKQTTQPLLAFPQHDLPRGYVASNIKNGTNVKLTSRNTEGVQTATGLRYSPVYFYDDLFRCINDYKKDFTFKLAESQTGAPKSNFIYENVHNNKLSWYPSPPQDLTRSTCFLKVMIKIAGDYDVRFIAISHQGSKTGDQYGSYNVGPLSEPTMSNIVDKAACIEFRCPGLVNDGGSISTDVSTFLEVNINPAKPNCRVSKIAKGTNITEEAGGKGFTFEAKAGISYGPRYGVYIGTRNRATMERFCFQGKDTGTIDIGMDPSLNTAIEYDCT